MRVISSVLDWRSWKISWIHGFSSDLFDLHWFQALCWHSWSANSIIICLPARSFKKVKNHWHRLSLPWLKHVSWLLHILWCGCSCTLLGCSFSCQWSWGACGHSGASGSRAARCMTSWGLSWGPEWVTRPPCAATSSLSRTSECPPSVVGLAWEWKCLLLQ